VHQGAIDVLGPVVRPSTVHQSKFSMGTVLALAARHGHAGLTEFDRDYLAQETVELRDKVSMELDAEVDAAYPRRWIGKVSVQTTDGRLLKGRVDEPKGDPGNTLSREEITAKALRLIAYGGVCRTHAQAAVAAVAGRAMAARAAPAGLSFPAGPGRRIHGKGAVTERLPLPPKCTGDKPCKAQTLSAAALFTQRPPPARWRHAPAPGQFLAGEAGCPCRSLQCGRTYRRGGAPAGHPMGQVLGQSVLVENTVGAGGTIAPARVAKAKADGYTILIHHMGMATAPALYKKLPYDPLKDFEYIGQVLDVPMTLLSRKDFPASNFAELLDYVRKNQDKVSLANAGIGAVSQLCGMLFMHQAGVKLTTVPYKGAGPAMNDLMGGQVDLLCDQTTQTVPVIKDGQRAKVFGVTTPQRLSSLPNIPTLDEQGLKGFDVKVWHGMYAPKGTPKEVVMAINKALNVAIKDENVKKRIAELSSDLVSPEKATPEGLRTHLQAEVARWDKVIKAAGVSAE
jgi:tripartite-type tricarboxylate transporter receptor subunit TctC